MSTRLVPTTLGPVSLAAPAAPPRQLAGAHGHLWQWVGDGRELISLTVAVRKTRLGTPRGVRDHLAWEIDRLRGACDPEHEVEVADDLPLQAGGARGSAAATVSGVREGVGTHNGLLVTTDGRVMHVLHVMATDTGPGRELARRTMTGLEVLEWTAPA